MNLKSITDKRDQYAKYMVDEITKICTTMEKRDPGSKGEEQACEYMADVLKNECGCDSAVVESFKENPGSFYGWIYITITSCFLAVAALIASVYTSIKWLPIVSILLIVFGLALAFLPFGLYFNTIM